jgi:Arc/MetJ-type ribon-helix-helix transcriptional regulator
MATTKITITVDDAVLAQVRSAVDAGEAANVSAYIAEAAAQRTTREARAAEIERRWGPFSPKALAWARKAAGAPPEPGDDAYLAEIEAERASRRRATSA